MDKIVVEGGHSLTGRVVVSGSKNATLPIMSAAILCQEPVTLECVPTLADIDALERLLCSFGLVTEREPAQRTMRIDARRIRWWEAPYDLVRKMRASFFALGPILGRVRKARFSLPGGCAIGARPVDIHLKGLAALGVELHVEHGYVEADASHIRSAHIQFEFASVGATENIVCAAVTAPGVTVLTNVAREPEVVDLCDFLNSAGAQIEGQGSDELVIHGVEGLGGTTWRIIPDRIEAGTYLCAGALAGGPITVGNARPDHLEIPLLELESIGARIDRQGPDQWGNYELTIERTGPLRPLRHLVTQTYPGFPTDLQAQFMAVLTLAEGTSMIEERIFENRFMHVPEMCRLGADIQIVGRVAEIHGVRQLSGSPVMASDLRASAALVLCGLVADGQTEVLRIYHLDRGYEDLVGKISGLGAAIQRKPA